MIAECVPALYVAFNAAFASLNDGGDWMAVESLYRDMDTYGFSQEVLVRCPCDLVVKRIDDVERNNFIAEASLAESVRLQASAAGLAQLAGCGTRGKDVGHSNCRNTGGRTC